MNKSFTLGSICLLLGAAGTSAQTVTVYGVADVFVARTQSGPNRVTGLRDGGNAPSRLGFRAREDLGGGLFAEAVLEGGINLDDGSGTLPGPGFAFTRQSSVGLGGPWGRVDAGRMLIPLFYGTLRADPMLVHGVFSQLNLLNQTDGQAGLGGAYAFRANDMVRYRTPSGLPFTVDLAYSFGEVASPNTKNAEKIGANIAYDRAPFTIGYSLQRVRSGTPAAPVAAPVTSKFDALSLAYDVLPALRLGLNYITITSSNGAVPKATLVNGGLRWTLGLSTVSLALSKREVENSPRAQRGVSAGYDHALSKRTALYARYLSLNNKANASATLPGVTVVANSGDDIRTIGFGVRHSF